MVILFREFSHTRRPFELSTICSKQVHVVFIVDPVSADLQEGFRFSVYRRSAMPPIRHLRGENDLLTPESPASRDLFLAKRTRLSALMTIERCSGACRTSKL